MKKILIILLAFFAISAAIISPQIAMVGYGATLPSTHSTSTYKVFYRTSTNTLHWYNGTSWVGMPSGTAWLLGTQATGANANIGMTDAFRFGITTNGTARMFFDADGRVRTGTATDVILAGSDSLKLTGTTVDIDGSTKFANRIQGKQGANVASANDLTLGAGNFFVVTGTTQITAITTTGWQAGSEIKIRFAGILTVKNNTAGGGGTAPILLQSGVDFITTQSDMLHLIYDGSNWNEMARSLN